MECLDDAAMYELAGGELEGEALAAADAHIDSCPECRAVLAGLLHTAESGGSVLVAAAPGLTRGQALGRYLVLDEIGGGAMGIVYAAYDPDLHRKVALKLLRAGGEQASDRMMREAQAMARLQHPNVVAIYEVGRAGDDIFIAMELVEGQTLTQWLREHRDAPIGDRLRIFAQAGKGLAAAHRAGLVHRDFKPDNVIVDDAGRARVTDFGLAHGRGEAAEAPPAEADLTASEHALAQSLTRTGTLLGTPAYMAPEQLRKEATDSRSDQFSFCVALFEAITGGRPFRGDTLPELCDAVLTGAMHREALERAPRWLRAVLDQGLALDPAARWASMEALVAELERERQRRRWLAPAVATATLGALLIGLIGTRAGDPADEVCTGAEAELARVWNGDRKRAIAAAFAATRSSYAGRASEAVIREIDGWAAAWIDAHRDTCRATRVQKRQSEALLDIRMACMRRRLTQLDALAGQLAGADRQTVAAAAGAIDALGSIEECADITALQTVVRPRNAKQARAVSALQRELARVGAMAAAGKYGDAASAAASAASRASDLGYAPAIAEARLLEARIAIHRGRAEEAERAAYDALWAAQKGRNDATAARAWLALLHNAGSSGRYDRAAHMGNHARAAIERIGSPPQLTARMLSDLGLIAYNRGEYASAARHLSRSLELTRKLGAGADVARVLTNLGNVARARGDYPGALAHHREAMAIDRRLRGPDHPVMGRHLHNVAGVLRLQGHLDAALERYRKALAIKRRALGDQHYETALTHNSIGLVQLERGELDSAQASFERALSIFGHADHGERGMALHNLGLTLAARGAHRRAVSHLTAALSAYEKAHGSAHERVARVALALARSERALHHRDRAQRWRDRAAKIAGRDPELAHIAAEARKAAPKPARKPAGKPARKPAGRPAGTRPGASKVAPKPAGTRPGASKVAPKPARKPSADTRPKAASPAPRRPARPTGPVYGPSQRWE